MDYTTLARVKTALTITTAGADALLAQLVTAASRACDRLCTGSRDPSAADYFAQASVVDEIVRGFVASDYVLHVWPHKASVSNVSAIAYRFSPRESWIDLDTENVELAPGGQVLAWDVLTRGKPFVKISYAGGYASETAQLPEDLIEAVTVLAARFYREAETNLADTIGIAEFGDLRYTKALPLRVKLMLQAFTRVVPW